MNEKFLELLVHDVEESLSSLKSYLKEKFFDEQNETMSPREIARVVKAIRNDAEDFLKEIDDDEEYEGMHFFEADKEKLMAIEDVRGTLSELCHGYLIPNGIRAHVEKYDDHTNYMSIWTPLGCVTMTFGSSHYRLAFDYITDSASGGRVREGYAVPLGHEDLVCEILKNPRPQNTDEIPLKFKEYRQ